jgi:hypothetical protein
MAARSVGASVVVMKETSSVPCVGPHGSSGRAGGGSGAGEDRG